MLDRGPRAPTGHGQLPLGESHSPITFSTKLSLAHFCACFPSHLRSTLLSNIPEEPLGAQHGTGAIAPVPCPRQSHSPTAPAPQHRPGEGRTESRQTLGSGRVLRLQHPKRGKAPFMFSVRAELEVFFLPDTFRNAVHGSADLAQGSSHAPVTGRGFWADSRNSLCLS